jgi:hypothetical protein
MTTLDALDHIRQSVNGSTDRTTRAGIGQFLTPAAIAQFMASLFEGGPGHGKGSAVDSPMEISDRGHGTHAFTEWLVIGHRSLDIGHWSFGSGWSLAGLDRANSTYGFSEWLGAYHRKTLRPPQRPSYYPEPTFVAWHVREVFQGEARRGGSP